MRVWGLIGLVVALAVVGLLVKRQMESSRTFVPALAAPMSAPVGTPAQAEPATAHERSRHIQQQYQQALDAALQQPRTMPDEAR